MTEFIETLKKKDLLEQERNLLKYLSSTNFHEKSILTTSFYSFLMKLKHNCCSGDDANLIYFFGSIFFCISLCSSRIAYILSELLYENSCFKAYYNT